MSFSNERASLHAIPSTEYTSGVKVRRRSKQAWRFFVLLPLDVSFQHLLRGIILVGRLVRVRDIDIQDTRAPRLPQAMDEDVATRFLARLVAGALCATTLRRIVKTPTIVNHGLVDNLGCLQRVACKGARFVARVIVAYTHQPSLFAREGVGHR